MWGRSRWLLAALAGVLAIMAVTAGIAVAVNVSDGTAGELQYQRNSEAVEAGDFTLRARCPSDRHVTGGGHAMDVETFTLQFSRPFDSADNGEVPDDGWLIGGDNPQFQGLNVYAICDN